ncbi:hypothetical protein [Curtobacterium sp. MCBD17_021]|uniref:hypothetical protein n=1 Tax=Curtobacterium sp. MCBD17_021 TaxID=2175665 RepID=UPI000DB5E4F6|nr:hypothetical protein [Curtobacterium sp. MCBD17_021]PZE65950.1 hypothetical protein DEI83_08020 [Curtobacterium sp. MCBD17_021]
MSATVTATTIAPAPIATALVGGPDTTPARTAGRRPSRPNGFSEVRETARRRLLAASALVVGLAAVTSSTIAVISLGVAA